MSTTLHLPFKGISLPKPSAVVAGYRRYREHQRHTTLKAAGERAAGKLCSDIYELLAKHSHGTLASTHPGRSDALPLPQGDPLFVEAFKRQCERVYGVNFRFKTEYAGPHDGQDFARILFRAT